MTDDEKSEGLGLALEAIDEAQAMLELEGVDTDDDLHERLFWVRDAVSRARDYVREVLGLPSEYLAELVRQRKHLTLVRPDDDDIPF